MFNKTAQLSYACLSLAVLSLAISGCSGAGKPVTGNVQGKVTLDGQPFSEGRVELKDAATGVTDAAELQPDGTFEIVNPDGGLRTGSYAIVVLPPPVQAVDPVESSKGVKPPAESAKIPAMYRDFATSGFKITVNKGANQADLDMKSK